MDYFLVFVCGGVICIVGQLFLDIFKLMLVYVMILFVVIGVILDGFGIYDKFIEFVGGGVIVLIVSFGYSFLYGVMYQVYIYGFIGIGMGIFELILVGILVVIFFVFIVVVIFKLKG